jgi:hypothetical protein
MSSVRQAWSGRLRVREVLVLGDTHDPAAIGKLNNFERGAFEPLMELAFYK